MLIKDGRGSRLPGVPDSRDAVSWDTSRLPEGWVPADIGTSSIRWVRTASDVTSESFFPRWLARVRAAIPPPLEFETNRDDLGQSVAHLPSVEPSGIICHVTRCGSTLVSNALSTLENVRTLSEVGWLDKMMLAASGPSEYWARDAADSLRHLTKILAYYRGSNAPSLVIKCGIWGAAALKGIKSLWPSTPLVMITRNPVEVIVSNLQGLPTALRDWYTSSEECPFGPVPSEIIRAGVPEFLAWIVGQMYNEALAQLDAGSLVLDYKDISPESVSAVARHFNLSVCSDHDGVFRNVFRFHAKRPGELFADDTYVRRQSAGSEITDAAERLAVPRYISLLDSALRYRAVNQNLGANNKTRYPRRASSLGQ
jgi:hypothetical protein